MRSLACLAGLALALSGCGSILPATVETRPASVDLTPAEAVAAALSAYRRERGLPAVSIDPGLTKVAEHQALGMAQTGRFSHEAVGTLPARLARFGVRHRAAAENLSAGATSPDEVMRRWRASSDHNANLLLPGARRIGVAKASAEGGRFRSYWVLVLAD